MSHTLDQVLPNERSHDAFCQKIEHCEQQWWQARQQLTTLKERRIFWFGDNSLIMWLVWQLVSYVVVAIVIMLISRVFDVQIALWLYITIFVFQTAVFLLLFSIKRQLAKRIQNRINEATVTREQALSEMIILAADSIFPDIHANAPMSLKQIYERYDGRLRLASLERLLQSEIDAERMLLSAPHITATVLPLELADNELHASADKMIYKSLIR